MGSLSDMMSDHDTTDYSSLTTRDLMKSALKDLTSSVRQNYKRIVKIMAQLKEVVKALDKICSNLEVHVDDALDNNIFLSELVVVYNRAGSLLKRVDKFHMSIVEEVKTMIKNYIPSETIDELIEQHAFTNGMIFGTYVFREKLYEERRIEELLLQLAEVIDEPNFEGNNLASIIRTTISHINSLSQNVNEWEVFPNEDIDDDFELMTSTRVMSKWIKIEGDLKDQLEIPRSFFENLFENL